VATLTPTQRRRFRKLRATARYYWHQIQKGIRPGTFDTLSWILKTLGGHHSRDPAFLQRVQTARSKILAMENGRQGWKCEYCRIMNKKNAEFCQKCGGYWTDCQEREGRSWTWTASSDSQSSRPRSSSARRRSKPNHSKGKGVGKDSGAKGKGAGKESSTKGNSGKNASSPFAYMPTSNTVAPWPILDFEQFQQAPATPTAQQQQVNQSTQDLVLALKKAFPETASIPPALREAMEKVESSGTRQITKDLHAATSALGRARKAHQEAHDARAKLRGSWMKHLQESLRAWESQLDSYRLNMAKLQDAEAKALQEVSNAKRTIQQLNSHAEGAGVEETAALEDMPDASSDKEEEKLRVQLQEAMTTCLSSVGVSAKKEVEEISDGDEENTSKRPRASETVKTGA